jgi:hypothetical protein
MVELNILEISHANALSTKKESILLPSGDSDKFIHKYAK